MVVLMHLAGFPIGAAVAVFASLEGMAPAVWWLLCFAGYGACLSAGFLNQQILYRLHIKF